MGSLGPVLKRTLDLSDDVIMKLEHDRENQAGLLEA